MADSFGDKSRKYYETHPWISFGFDLRKLACPDWIRLGEALAKCDHIANVALPPAVSFQLHQLYVVRGVLGSAQIEGNALTEDQAMAQFQGNLELPETQEYQAKDFDNIRAASEMVAQEVAQGLDLRLTTDRIKHFNTMVLDGQPIEPGVIPGAIRTYGITVGNVYKGPPAEDCEYLLEKLCAWLDSMMSDAQALGPEWERSIGVIRAVLAHLYLAWIHPFGDGNGRTARLIEFQLLLAAGFPTPACHLLSNYYNKTRNLYYQALRETSQAEGYPVERFASYAIKGFVEELREQVNVIQRNQLGQAWLSLVSEIDLGRQERTSSRRRALLLALDAGSHEDFTPLENLDRLNADITALYAKLHPKTMTRDIHVLMERDLLLLNEKGDGVRPAFEQLFRFLPIRKAPTEPDLADKEEALSLADTVAPATTVRAVEDGPVSGA